MGKFYVFLVSAGLSLSAIAMADTVPNMGKVHKIHKTHSTRAVQKSAHVVPTVSYFKVTGYIEGSYNNETRNKFISGSYDRFFDQVPNGLTLQQAATTVAYQPLQGMGGFLNLIAGRDANIIAPYGFRPVSEFDSQTLAVDFTQVYLQYVVGPVTVIGGRFTTLVGVEQIDPTQNTNFSRGILFYNTPNTHTGLRATYTVNDKLNVIAGINDGWDTIRDWSRRKTVELGMNYKANSIFSFSVQGYSGEERATSQTAFGPTGTRTLIDIIATVNATDKLAFIVNYDNGWQTQSALLTGGYGRASWVGLAGYLNYKCNDKWLTSLRGEVFDDKNGIRTGVRQNWRELTLTMGYDPIKNLELRAEARHDFSNVNAFVNSTGVSISNNQQSYAFEGVYKFG